MCRNRHRRQIWHAYTSIISALQLQPIRPWSWSLKHFKRGCTTSGWREPRRDTHLVHASMNLSFLACSLARGCSHFLRTGKARTMSQWHDTTECATMYFHLQQCIYQAISSFCSNIYALIQWNLPLLVVPWRRLNNVYAPLEAGNVYNYDERHTMHADLDLANIKIQENNMCTLPSYNWATLCYSVSTYGQ